MLVVSIGYGLGNQMFEYAYVQKLRSLYPDYEILIDTDKLNKQTLRNEVC